jgi:hypothetical protein
VTSPETKELMNRTWQDLELTTKAHTFSGKVKIDVKVFFFSPKIRRMPHATL